jgi:hypothetical protein
MKHNVITRTNEDISAQSTWPEALYVVIWGLNSLTVPPLWFRRPGSGTSGWLDTGVEVEWRR